MYALYFDYTGAGRGPEPVAGPFKTEQEAHEYADENDYPLVGDTEYFIDFYYEV